MPDALILAAGRGDRMRDQGLIKPLVPFLGVPLLERAMTVLARIGVRRIVVATGWQAEAVSEAARRYGARLGVEVEPVYAPDWERGNGASAAAAAGRFDRPFLLVMCDHLFEPEMLAKLAEQTPPARGLVLAVDRNLSHPLVDWDDVTCVRVEGAAIRAIGKGLPNPDGFDTGAFLLTPEALARLKEERIASMTELVRRLAEEGRAQAWDASGYFWADLDRPDLLQRAEALWLAKIAGKAHDGPVSRRLNRPISVRLSRWFIRHRIRPMQITWLAFAMSVVAALFVAMPSWWAIAFGGILAQLASIVDGCDGEVARATYQESDYGGWVDAVLDRYADALLLGAMCWHALVHEMAGMSAVAAGLAALSGALINSYTADKYDGWMRKHQKAYRFRLGRDVRVFAFFLACLLDAPMALLVLTAAVMHLENLRRLWVVGR